MVAVFSLRNTYTAFVDFSASDDNAIMSLVGNLSIKVLRTASWTVDVCVGCHLLYGRSGFGEPEEQLLFRSGMSD